MKLSPSTVLFLCCSVLGAVQGSRSVRQVPSDYNSGEPPEATVEVEVGLYVRNLEYVSTLERKYKTQLLLRMSWFDLRLSYGSLEKFQNFPVSQLWTPEVFFSNELQSVQEGTVRDDSTVRVSWNGEVHLDQRVSAELSCPMNTRNFPFDTQRCPLILSSWTAPESQLKLSWSLQPVVVNKHAYSVGDFNLRRFETENCSSSTPTDVFPCLQVNLTFERSLTPYLIRLYSPMGMCVIIACFSFWIQCSPVRITLLMIDLLGAVAVGQLVVYNSAPEDFMTYVDIFSAVSLSFVFLALLEFVVVQYIFKRELMNEKIHSMMNDIKSNALDILCRVLMPLVYGFFVAAYFAVAHFLIKENDP